VVSTVLDAAMTHCLFAREIEAYTAELTVRFRHPVRIDEPLEVSAHVSRDNAPLYELQAEIRQDGQLRATGRGKFLQKPTETHP
jgi:acyl-CoA thioesterase FadM